MKRKKIEKAAAALVVAALLTACGGGAGHAEEKKLQKLVDVVTYEIQETEYGTLEAAVTVTMPDYSQYLEQCIQEAAESTESEKELEKKLYQMTEKLAKDDTAPVTREITVKLSELDPDKTADQWKETEIHDAAREAAFETEVEEFCLTLRARYYEEFAQSQADESQTGASQMSAGQTGTSQTGEVSGQ